MKNSILILLLACMFAIGGCSKWTEEDALTVQELSPTPDKNAPGYAQYLKNLKDYKSANHPVLLGWFDGWDAHAASNKLINLPDSLDMIAILAPDSVLTEEQKADMKSVQAEKGTKVLYNLKALAVSDSINAHRASWPTGDSAAVAAYVGNVLQRFNADGYDGIILNTEGASCASCVSLFKTPAMMNYLLSLLGNAAGTASSSSKLFLLQGIPTDIPQDGGSYFNYFISNTNASLWKFDIESAYESFKSFKGFSASKLIVTTTFQTNEQASYGGLKFNNADGTQSPTSLVLAAWNPAGGVKGGTGIYYINNDYYNVFPDYGFSKKVIQIQNPSQHSNHD